MAAGGEAIMMFEVRYALKDYRGTEPDVCTHDDLDDARACARTKAADREKGLGIVGPIVILKTETLETL